MRRAFSSKKACLFTALVLAGCAVGPDFTPPAAPEASAYDSDPVPPKTADGAQQFIPAQDIPAEWWKLFHSQSLNRLIEQAVKDNPDLAAANAALKVAQDNLGAGEAAFVPKLTGSFASTRAKASTVASNGASPSYYYTLHNASVGVSYNPDVWGGTRRSVENLQAQADAAKFQKEAAYLALTSNVVTLAITEASLRDQIAATQEIIKAQEKVLNIFKLRFEAGAVAKSSVLAQQTSLASVKATLPALQHRLAVTRHALSALAGKLPEKQAAAPFRLTDLKLPEKLPLSLPSKLVEQRPDVRAAQENLHAASAAIGMAVSARLPSVLLTGDIGSMANVFDKLFSPGGGFWTLGASVAGTIFDAGALADKEQAARDAFEVAEAQYRKTVLAAFQDVADTLHALQSDAEGLNAKRDAEKAAAESLELTKQQFSAGATGSAELFLAQQAHQQAKVAYVQAQAQRYADTAALFAALGGGWWNRCATVQSGRGPQ
ncbi:MAG: efflux transporter outer membrane subunit [Alphaproteobacteria bacterium]|nr:efflux transporter outer membrane subunit [Alphaproteobacteria bacterium]